MIKESLKLEMLGREGGNCESKSNCKYNGQNSSSYFIGWMDTRSKNEKRDPSLISVFIFPIFNEMES
jgi:hypothetical protein